MHFEVDAIAQVTSVPVASGEQLVCLFGRFRLHTPLAGHKHDGVEHLQLGCGLLFSAVGPKGGLGGAEMKSPVVKRSIRIAGHKTSISLENDFWRALKEIAGERHKSLSALVAAIEGDRQHSNLSSAIRLFVLEFYRSRFSSKPGDETSV